MSANNPIPQRLRAKFFGHMAAHDHDDVPDGAWWAMLESAAEQFMQQHGLTQPWQCPNSAAYQYIRSNSKRLP